MTSDLPRGMTQHHSNSSWRWTPTPARRERGWRSVTFKNADGTNMTKGQALDAAEAINRLVDAFERGEDIAGRPWAHLNPDASTHVPVASGPAPDSIGVLIDRWQTSDTFLELRPSTQRGYRQCLKQLVDAQAGFMSGTPATAADRKRYDTAVATVRTSTVTAYFSDDELLPDLYKAVCKAGKISMANHIAAVAQTWLNWVIRDRRLRGQVNPADAIERKSIKGRVVIWSRDEEALFLKTARAMGWHNVAWAAELALELSWSQIDILALQWGQVKTDPNGTMRVKGTRSKTQNMTHTTLTNSGRDLIARMKSDWHARHGAGVEPGPTTPMLVVDAHGGRSDRGAAGKKWNEDYFRHTFITIKKQCRPIIDKTFQDLRDTAITRMKEAGLDVHQIQSRSQHSLAQINNILDKHYGMTTLEISDAAAARLNGI